MYNQIIIDDTTIDSNPITETDLGPISSALIAIPPVFPPVNSVETDFQNHPNFEEQERAYDEERARAYDEEYELAIEDGLGRLLPWYRIH